MAGFTVNSREIRAHLSAASRRDATVRGRRVEARAKVLCPVDTNRLRSSIRMRPVHQEAGRAVWVAEIGTPVVYAPAIHEGRGSPYAPRSWRNRGPGPRRFLSNALAAARGR